MSEGTPFLFSLILTHSGFHRTYFDKHLQYIVESEVAKNKAREEWDIHEGRLGGHLRLSSDPKAGEPLLPIAESSDNARPRTQAGSSTARVDRQDSAEPSETLQSCLVGSNTCSIRMRSPAPPKILNRRPSAASTPEENPSSCSLL